MDRDIQTAATDAWTAVGVDLSSYLGQQIYLSFDYTANGEGDIGIDLVQVQSCGVLNTYDADFSADATSVCEGTTVTFNDASTGSAGITSWSWDFGDGTTSTLQNPTHTYATAGTYDVSLIVNGSANTETKTGYITVNPSPTVDLGADIAICDGTTQTLDAGSGHTNYLWSTGATTQTIDVTTSGTYSVTVGNGTPVTNTNSLSFDGNDDYVNLNSKPISGVQNTFSIASKFKLNSVSNGQGIYFHRGHYKDIGIRYESTDGLLHFFNYNQYYRTISHYCICKPKRMVLCCRNL